MIRARVPPIALIVVGLVLTVGLTDLWLSAGPRTTGTWAINTFLLLLAIAMLALACAVTLDPRPIVLRRALAGAALAWLVFLCAMLGAVVTTRPLDATAWALTILVVVDALALLDLAATTGEISTGPRDPLGRFGAVIVFAAAILMATGAAVVVLGLVRLAWRLLDQSESLDRLPWGLVVLVVVVPLLLFGGGIARIAPCRGRDVLRAADRQPAEQRAAGDQPGRDRRRDGRDHHRQPDLRSRAGAVGRRDRRPVRTPGRPWPRTGSARRSSSRAPEPSHRTPRSMRS